VSDVRAELHEALDIPSFPNDTLLERAVARLDQPRPRRAYAWPASVGAGLVAAALIATLVMVRLNGAGVTPGVNTPTMPSALIAPDIVSYQFVSSQVGWAEIYIGNAIIARTSDGGRTWHRLIELSGVTPVPTLQVMSATDAVVFGQQGFQPTVWRTSDAGGHWQTGRVQIQLAELTLISGSFVDNQHGWVALVGSGDCSTCMLNTASPVYATSNGGATWVNVSTLQHDTTNNYIQIRFVSRSLGFALIGFHDRLYRTTDGGHSWSADSPAPGIAIACPPGKIYCPYLSVELPTFFSSAAGILVATVLPPCDPPPFCDYVSAPPRYLYSTTDEGQTWTQSGRLPVNGQLLFVNLTRAVGVSSDGLDETVDGSSWSTARPIPIQSGWYLSTAQFQDLHHGWIALSDDPNGARTMANGGTTNLSSPRFQLLYTSDGGRSWTHVSLPSV